AVHAGAEGPSQRGQQALRCVIEQRGECLPDTVDLVATIKGDVLRRDFPVQSQIACRPCRRHTKALNQAWATNLTEEVEPEVDVGQPLALGVAQALDARGLGHRRLIIHDGRPKDCDWFYVCPLVAGSHHQNDDIMRDCLSLSKQSKWNRTVLCPVPGRAHAIVAPAIVVQALAPYLVVGVLWAPAVELRLWARVPRHRESLSSAARFVVRNRGRQLRGNGRI